MLLGVELLEFIAMIEDSKYYVGRMGPKQTNSLTFHVPATCARLHTIVLLLVNQNDWIVVISQGMIIMTYRAIHLFSG